MLLIAYKSRISPACTPTPRHNAQTTKEEMSLTVDEATEKQPGRGESDNIFLP